MKQIITITTLFTFFTVASLAQSSIRVGLSYAMPMNSELIGEEKDEIYDEDSGTGSHKVNAVYGSLGAGLGFHAAFSKSIKNGPLGLDLDLGYVVGKEYKVTSNFSSDTYEATETMKTKAKSFQITPSLTFAHALGKQQLYTRIGPVFSFTSIEFNESFTEDGDLYEIQHKDKGGIGVGFRGVIGFCFNADSKIQFFSELSFTSLSYAPKEGEFTKYKINGVDILDTLGEDLKISYKKSYSYTDGQGENMATQPKYSLGSISLQAGVRFAL
jgi:hypothetical protein